MEERKELMLKLELKRIVSATKLCRVQHPNTVVTMCVLAHPPREDLIVTILEIPVLLFPHRIDQLVLMEIQHFM